MIGVIESKLAIRVASQAGTSFITSNQAKNNIHQSERDDASPETSGSYTLDECGRFVFPEDAVARTNLEHVLHGKDYFRSRDLIGLGLQELLPPEKIQQEL